MGLTPEGATIWVALIVTIGGIITTIIQQRRHGKRLGEVHEQVKNSHDTNLRQDIDEIKYNVRSHGQQIAQLNMRVDRMARGTVYGYAHAPELSKVDN